MTYERRRRARRDPDLGELLINDFVLPFEITAVLLLSAIIGALALVRETREV